MHLGPRAQIYVGCRPPLALRPQRFKRFC